MLKLTQHTQPSDLRGSISGTTGTAEVLGGSGDEYLVYGGSGLSGTIADANGNQGTFQAFEQSELFGPTASNESPHGLEDPVKMRGGRALILENIDGFGAREVFRASPHLLNIADTAPYGLSGEFPDLRVFSSGAVTQHFPLTLDRVSGLDFRPPEANELEAMEAFMNSIVHPGSADFNLDRFATTEAQKRGRELFFSEQGKCSKCHSGPVLAHSDGSLPGSVDGENEDFNTGVANLPINGPGSDNLPTEPAGMDHGESTRAFNTPPLFGVRLTPPFFHDGSAATLGEAVEFYDTFQFISSPAGADVGSIQAANSSQSVADLVAFLESLVEIPVQFPAQVDFGSQGCLAESDVLLASVTNTGTTTLAITDVVINGTDQSLFSISSDSGEGSLAPGQSRVFGLVFNSGGDTDLKEATLEVTADDGGTLGVFSFGIVLRGEACTSMERWQIEHFGLANVQNPTNEATLWGVDASPDKDIFPNIMEFLHGLDPNQPEFEPQITTGHVNVGGQMFVTYSFVKRRNLAGTSLSVVTSGDVAGPFTAIPIVETELDPVDPEFVLATATDTVPVTPAAPRFGKIVIVPASP